MEDSFDAVKVCFVKLSSGTQQHGLEPMLEPSSSIAKY
jgi:hypothetical protein